MRKSKKEITDIEQMIEVLDTCKVFRLAVIDEGVPYIVPLNYGYTLEDNQLTLYFHSAGEGRKIDVLKKNPRVAFEMDCGFELIKGEVACDFNNKYRSITGTGIAEFLETNEEKLVGLEALMRQYDASKLGTFKEEVVSRTCVVRIRAEEYAGKQLV
jgi:nitroimidazol reductase NimA-like FMN-containing flavoprotein (pyridoxamine 5'-phosphate oxidase superfamily)